MREAVEDAKPLLWLVVVGVVVVLGCTSLGLVGVLVVVVRTRVGPIRLVLA